MSAKPHLTLICEPVNGLANRLLPLLSSLRLVDKLKAQYDVELLIHWEKSPDCQAKFHDLFTGKLTVPGFEYSQLNLNTAIEREDCQFIDARLKFDVKSWADSPILEKIPAQPTRPLWIRSNVILGLPEDLEKGEHPGMATQAPIFVDGVAMELGKYLDGMELSEPVQTMLKDSAVPSKSCRVWGAHIRVPFTNSALAEIDAKTFSFPSPDFHANMIDKVLGCGAFDKVFVCSNSPAIEEQLRQKYGDRILTNSKRNEEDHSCAYDLQSGLVDQLTLRNCGVISRFQKSSFAVPAIIFGKVPSVEFSQSEDFDGERAKHKPLAELSMVDFTTVVLCDPQGLSVRHQSSNLTDVLGRLKNISNGHGQCRSNKDIELS